MHANSKKLVMKVNFPSALSDRRRRNAGSVSDTSPTEVKFLSIKLISCQNINKMHQ